MNVVFLSPHFPPSYYLFCVALKRLGANVLGIAEEPYEHLRPELKDSLTEYYRVGSLEDYDQALRACGYFTYRYGRIDRIASHNEHWLELEAYLRESFDVFGPKVCDTDGIRRKSVMKQKFAGVGISVAPGRLVRTPDELQAFIREVGYPVIVKPDKGVGAIGTYKLSNEADVDDFARSKPDVDYFVEAFVDGEIVTFDGLADHGGNVVFCMSLKYSRNIMETVAEDTDIYYYTLRDLEEDVVAAGTASVDAFALRESFFHFEFFRTPAGKLLALELNARPPGWPTTDMFNYANDADVYREWANAVMRKPSDYEWRREYHAIYIGRKARIRYAHSHEEIVAHYGRYVMDVLQLPHVFSRAMGDYAYIARSGALGDLEGMAEYAQQRAPGQA
jgi:biotin carboxylase